MTDQSVNVTIRAIDQFTATAAKVTASTKTMGSALTGFGNGLNHAKSQIGGLVGKLGFLGLAGGVLSFTGSLEQSITKAQDWGLQIEKLQGITHDTAEQLSGLLAVTEKYGLSNERLAQIAGFTEKALGNIAVSGKGVTDFTDKFGFSLTDAKGKILDFNTLLLKFADYWNSNAAASTKAAAAAHLFGRGYADLVPVLNLGSKGIQAAEEEAKALGLTLTQDNVAALAKAREATRQWGDALSGLELQIGLALLPSLTDLAKTATKFVSEHRDDIVGFFKSAATFAGQLGDAIHTVVVPAISAIGSAWNAIPKEMRDLLIGGVVAQKASHWLFGSGPLDWAKNLLGAGASKIPGIGGALADATAQPVRVVNWPAGFGGTGGVNVGNVAEAAGGAGLAGVATAAIGAIAGSAAFWGAVALIINANPKTNQNSVIPGVNHMVAGPHGAMLFQDLPNPTAGKTRDDMTSSTIGRNPDKSPIDTSSDTRETRAIASYNRLITATATVGKDIISTLNRWGLTAEQWAKMQTDAYKAGGHSLINTLAGEKKAADAIAIATLETDRFLNGTAGPFFKDGKNQTRLIASLQRDQAYFRAHGDTKTAAALGADIAALKGEIGKQKPPVVNVYSNISVTDMNNRMAVRIRIGPTSGSAGTREGTHIS